MINNSKIKIYIWGTGKYGQIAYDSFWLEKCEVCGAIDSNPDRRNIVWNHALKIFLPEDVLTKPFDYIVITAKNFSKDIMAKCMELGIVESKVISFWEDDLRPYGFLNPKPRELFYSEIEERKLRNRPYELGQERVPMLLSAESLLNRLIERRDSLCRYGDGEFEIMRDRNRAWFQEKSAKLQHRLLEVIGSDREDVIIAIADNFGNLDKYTEDAANAIRRYMTLDTRADIMSFLNSEHAYYDAYVSRPYIMNRDKDYATEIFALWKRVWDNRNLVIVEGKYSRLGEGNDLFDNAAEIRRVICPEKDAFAEYDRILAETKALVHGDELILISLGPTATVLAYDLAVEGYQAVDIGQIDTEYEWSLRGAEYRVPIEGKGVAELSWCHVPQE